jgi:hypothetical protein
VGPTTGISAKKRNLLDGIADHKSRKAPKGPPTPKEQYQQTRKNLESRLKEAKADPYYRQVLERLEKEAKEHAKKGLRQVKLGKGG